MKTTSSNTSSVLSSLNTIKDQKELDLYRRGYVKTPNGEWIKKDERK